GGNGPFVIENVFVDEGKDIDGPGGVEVSDAAVRKLIVGDVEIVHGHADLLEIIGASNAIAGLAHLLHCGHQHAHENCDDGDDHEEFDQGKSSAATLGGPGHGLARLHHSPLEMKNQENGHSACIPQRYYFYHILIDEQRHYWRFLIMLAGI